MDQKGKKGREILNSLLHNEATVGIVLLLCAIAAVSMASFPQTRWFGELWGKDMGIIIGDFSLKMSLRHWINDALMAIFFFVVGLEIKAEMLAGHLSSIKKATLPVLAAAGGMVVPALIYSVFNIGDPAAERGWGIPMATDIAFAIGIISILGSRVPVGLKIFLAALAVVDDLGAIIVLAIFYPSHALHTGWMILAAATFIILFIFNRRKLRNRWLYILPGFFLWYFVYQSGIHATVAGVLLSMVIPSRGKSGELKDSMLKSFEHGMKPYVNFLVMPLFALANAGVALDFSMFSGDAIPGVSLGIFFGLLVGKPLGIFLASWLGVKMKFASLPEGIRWNQVVAMGILGGIGFTMSIFINSLAFTDPALTDMGKMSILIASASAAIIGLAVLRMTCPSEKESYDVKNI